MHLRGNVIYNTWENFWKKAYKSSYFRDSMMKLRSAQTGH